MDFLLPLTIIGFLISIYSISEEYKKRNFVFKFNWFDKIAFGFLSLLILASVVLDIFWSEQSNNLLWIIGKYIITWNLLISIIALVISITIIIYFGLKLNSKTIIKKEAFSKNLRDLLNKKRFEDLTADLQIYFKDIFSSKNKELDNVRKDIVNNAQFVSYLAINNVQLALNILQKYNGPSAEKLWDKTARVLLEDKDSRLYTELNSGFSGKTELLNFFFKDTNQCERWLVWKPVGDYVIEYVEAQGKLADDENNKHQSNYDAVKNSSPIYIGTMFFQLMVKKALEQNTPDHMWLYYLGYWTEKICKNIKYENEDSAEFKNMYEYYLYQIFDSYREWIEYIKDADYTVATGEKGPNIVENAINSFTFAMEDISKSPNVRDDFKSYLREIYLNVYMDLATAKPKAKFKPYVDYFNNRLSGTGEHPRVKPEFIRFLLVAVNNPMTRDIWYQGAHYSMNQQKSQVLNDFQTMLTSLINNILGGIHNDI